MRHVKPSTNMAVGCNAAENPERGELFDDGRKMVVNDQWLNGQVMRRGPTINDGGGGVVLLFVVVVVGLV